MLAVLRPRDPAEVEVLLIERADRPGDPGAGHVALPGGHVDAADGSLARTALRELEEEVGLSPRDLADGPRYLGVFRANAFRLDVAVFVAEWRAGGAEPIPRDPGEVAGIFWLPHRELFRAERIQRSSVLGEALWVEASVFDGHVTWGFTRRILLELFGRLFAEPTRPGLEGRLE